MSLTDVCSLEPQSCYPTNDCGGGGHPHLDGIVSGTSGNDLIDTNYTGDPQGDMIDHNDAVLPGAAPNDDYVLAGAGNDTVLAGLGNDQVYGGTGNDLLYGGAGNDSLYGDAGNDTLSGDAGNNALYGGDGNDTFIGGAGADTFYGGTGQDNIDYSTSSSGVTVDLTTGHMAGGEAANDSIGGGIDGVIGSNYGDSLVGFDQQGTSPSDTYTNQFYGMGGNDTIEGKGGSDLIYGGTGNDQIYGGGGNDSLYGDAGNDALYAGAAPGGTTQAGGDAYMSGGDGNDTLYGGTGHDSLFGGDGNDSLVAGSGSELMYGGGGSDTLVGGSGSDTMYGGDGGDHFVGGSGNDSMYGGAGSDVFSNVHAGDFVDGGEACPDNGPGDQDTLDLTGAGPFKIVYDPHNPENGTVNFLDSHGNITGHMDFHNIECVVPCFTPGTLIATPKGERPVEELKAGDRIITRDNGIQEIRWVGQKAMDWKALAANPHLKPILIQKGALGNGLPESDMMVSPNHRVLVANERTALYFDEHEVLVAAKHLINNRGVHEVASIGTAYIHFMFDNHEVVLSNGAWTESFQPGDYTLKGMGNAQRNEIYDLFPDLKTVEGLETYGSARKTLKRHEAMLLAK